MRAMGVNEIVYEMRSGDGDQPTPFPDCKLSTWLGPLWPQPTAAELAGLGTVFELARQHGMRVMLFLNYTHMEEQPPTNAERWLGAILNTVKNDPALDLVAFGGDRHVVTGTAVRRRSRSVRRAGGSAAVARAELTRVHG